MKIGSKYLNTFNGRQFVVEDIKLHVNDDNNLEVFVHFRWIDGFYAGTTGFFMATSDSVNLMKLIEE